MYKLCENGYTMILNDYSVFIPHVVDYDECDEKDYSYKRYPFGGYNPSNKINLNVFFDKNHDGINKHEYLMYQIRNISSDAILPLDINTITALNTIKSVEFVFTDALPDTPLTHDVIKNVPIEIDNVRCAIDAFALYISYKLIAYLPYADFAIDHMPCLDMVKINGEPSKLFDTLISHLNEEFKDVTFIHQYKNGKYSYSYSEDFEKVKGLYIEYIRVNMDMPIFFNVYKKQLKVFKKFEKIEISLRWFNNDKKDYLTNYEDSDIDDYLYSSNGIHGILTLGLTYQYLISYYMNEQKSIRNNHFLIVLITGYFKDASGLKAIRAVQYDKSVTRGIVDLLSYFANAIYDRW